MKLVGLSGKAGSGKDWVTQHVLRPLGYFQVSFADHLKITAVGRGLASYTEVYLTKPDHVRKFMQEEGTERGRNVYGENIWINTAFAWMQLLEERNGIDKFVVADVRFPNEADAVKAGGGVLIRLDAPKRVSQTRLTAAQRAHLSETAMDNYTGYTAVFANDEDGRGKIAPLIEGLLTRFLG